MKLSDYVFDKKDRLVNDCEFDCLGLATENYGQKRVVSYCMSEKYISSVLENKSIVGIIISQEILERVELPNDMGLVITPTPKAFYYDAYNIIVDRYNKERFKPNFIHPTAKIHSSVSIAKNNVYIGKNTVIEPNTVIYEYVHIGNDVKIGPNNVLGGPAFQFYKKGDKVINVKCLGELVIEDMVETQSTCSIDNGVFKTVRIGKNTKLDSYAQIAHDFICGERCLIMAHAVISGRVTMGDDVYIGPSVSIVNGLKVGNKSKASIGAVVTKNIEDGQQVSGNFAIPHKKLIDHVKDLAK